MPKDSFPWLAVVLALTGALIPLRPRAEVDDRTRVALEALSRLKDTDLEASPALKQAVLKVLEQVRGEPEFVELVRDFRLPGHEAELIRFAAAHPQSPQAVEGIRQVLAAPDASRLEKALQEEAALPLVELLGATGDRRTVPLLQALVTDGKRPIEVRRGAVKALAKTEEGADLLLALARAGTLPAELRPVAGAELRNARWSEVRTSAATLFEAGTTAGAGELPPLAELMSMSGDPQRGAAIFRRPEVACITCHQVNAEGVDFGPKLSEIGAKLGRDALIAAILEPSAGISFGFEAWRIELKNGNELFGLIVSDTADELAVKQQGGQVTRVKPAEVASREKQPLSIMPSGLQQSLSAQEFVDLIAYLASLKKADPAPGR